MPSTLVHAALAVLLALGLLRGTFDRRVLAVLLVAMALPEIDAILGPVYPGAHRTVGHTLVIPLVLGALLYYDTRVREQSLLRERVADRGVHVAWVVLFAHVFAHLFLDWAHLDGINLLWPLRDQFYRLEGELFVSTSQGVVQTFVDVSLDPTTGERAVDAGERGARESVHVNNPVEPDGRAADRGDEPVDRRFPVAERGWQFYLLATGLFALVAKRFQRDPPADDA